jgi:hypothetical protein
LASSSLLNYSNFTTVNKWINKNKIDVWYVSCRWLVKMYRTWNEGKQTKNEEFLDNVWQYFIHLLTHMTYYPSLGSFTYRSYLRKLLYKSLCHRVTFVLFYFQSPNIRGFANLGGGVIFLSLISIQIMLLVYTLYQCIDESIQTILICSMLNFCQ